MASYWERRKAELMWEQMETAEQTAEKIIAAYQTSYQYVTDKSEQLYKKAMGGEQISRADTKRLMQAIRSDSYEEVLATSKRLGLDKITEILESPGYREKFRKYESIKKSITEETARLREKERTVSTTGYQKIAADGYYKSIYELQKQTGLAFSFQQFDSRLYEKVINSNWRGKNYSERIWHNTEQLAASIKNELLQGLVAGKTQNEMVKAIQQEFQQGAYTARRLVRTESCYISNEMERQAYEECEIEKCMFVATLDLRTSELCASKDGQIIDVKTAVPGIDLPPLHPFCRSTTIAYIDSAAMQRMERRARNPETGKLEKVPAGMKYGEWKQKYVNQKGLGSGNESIGEIPEHKPAELLEKIDIMDTELIQSKLMEYEEMIAQEPIENAIVITQNGEVYRCYGTLNGVHPEEDLGDKLKGAVMTHNHPVGSVNEYSFSNQDINLFMEYELETLRGIDKMFVYELNRTKMVDDPMSLFEATEYDARHNEVISKALKLNIGYRRKKHE